MACDAPSQTFSHTIPYQHEQPRERTKKHERKFFRAVPRKPLTAGGDACTLPASKTRRRSEFAIVLSRWAIVSTVQLAKCSRMTYT